jgi:hypothetical protein
MLVRLLYVSQAVGPITTSVTSSILDLSSQSNKNEDITGVLCQGTGLYMQVLEGPRGSVNRLFAKIMADKRHEHIELLSMEDITHREFGQWSMALVHLSKDDPMVKMKHPEFDPYSASSSEALKLMHSLIKAGIPIDKVAQ